jgi:hypothetical protein
VNPVFGYARRKFLEYLDQPSLAEVDDELMQQQYLAEMEPHMSSGQTDQAEVPELGITYQQAKAAAWHGWRVEYVAPRPGGGDPAYAERGVIANVPGNDTAPRTSVFVRFDGDTGAKSTPLDRLRLLESSGEPSPEVMARLSGGEPLVMAAEVPELDSEPDEWLLSLVTNVLREFRGRSVAAAAKAVLDALARADGPAVTRALYGPPVTEPAAYEGLTPPAYHQVDPFGPPPWGQQPEYPPVAEQAALVPEPVEYRRGDRVIYQGTPTNPPLFAIVKGRASGNQIPPGLAEYDIRIPYQGTGMRAAADQLRPYPLGAAAPENTGEGETGGAP